ncbi:MAG: serine/threonine protein kinase [Deltaproteobacteria bacterium]|nr:serine/threonine protein kinase [Deltaproteobacteria bacterium]
MGPRVEDEDGGVPPVDTLEDAPDGRIHTDPGLPDDDEVDFLAPEPTDVVDPFSPGSFFADRFRLGEPLGTGGMGAVFRAEDLMDQRPVAIKILLKGAQDEHARQRFERESQILASIDHPGIVSILRHGYATHRRIPWLAMELLEGETLRDLIQRTGPMDPSRVASILSSAADALEAAHAQGVIHRDLKPDNIFLPESGPSVKLLDFGLSLSLSAKKLTATGTVIGTPRYMAPEQIASAHKSGAAADIYALGVVVYECLTGESPFAASDQGQLLGAILQGRLEPLSNRRPDLPDAIGEVVERAMARKPEDRFATPRELAEAFIDAIGGRVSKPRFSVVDPVRASSPSRTSSPSRGSRPSKPAKNETLKWVGLVVLGLIAAAASAIITYSLITGN